jgi:hypothetical protein
LCSAAAASLAVEICKQSHPVKAFKASHCADFAAPEKTDLSSKC